MTFHGRPIVVLTARQVAMLLTFVDLSRLRTRNQHSPDAELADLLSSLESGANAHLASCAAATGMSVKSSAMASSRLMNPTEAAARLGITEQAVRRALAEERLVGEKVQGRWQITAAAVDDFDSRLRPESGPVDMTVRVMLHARAQVVELDQFVAELAEAGLRFAIADESRGATDRIGEIGVALVHTESTHAPCEPVNSGQSRLALTTDGSVA